MAEVEHLIAELVDIGDDVNEIFSKVLGEDGSCAEQRNSDNEGEHGVLATATVVGGGEQGGDEFRGKKDT